MIGIEVLGINCPKCGIPTMGGSAKAHVIKQALGYEVDIPDLEEVCYSVCPSCLGMILPKEFNPKKSEEV